MIIAREQSPARRLADGEKCSATNLTAGEAKRGRDLSMRRCSAVKEPQTSVGAERNIISIFIVATAA
jgi:hypothetical protein